MSPVLVARRIVLFPFKGWHTFREPRSRETVQFHAGSFHFLVGATIWPVVSRGTLHRAVHAIAHCIVRLSGPAITPKRRKAASRDSRSSRNQPNFYVERGTPWTFPCLEHAVRVTGCRNTWNVFYRGINWLDLWLGVFALSIDDFSRDSEVVAGVEDRGEYQIIAVGAAVESK